MDDINRLISEAQAAAARDAAIRRERERQDALDDAAAAEAPATGDVGGVGILEVARRQGRWRSNLAGHRIRSGEALDVYVNPAVGWVRGVLFWARSPHTPPSVRVAAYHPEARGRDGEPLVLGEVELLLPEEAVCRWPEGAVPDDTDDE